MRVFDEPNMVNFICPICGTNDKGQVVLVGIDGTEDGHNMQAKQVHLGCLELRMAKNIDEWIIYQFIHAREETGQKETQRTKHARA